MEKPNPGVRDFVVTSCPMLVNWVSLNNGGRGELAGLTECNTKLKNMSVEERFLFSFSSENYHRSHNI